MDITKHEYQIDINWNENRVGNMSSPQLNETVKVATPPPFEGGVEGVWSPEHLLVASVSSCLMTTFLAIAQYSKLEFESLNITAVGKLDKKDGKIWMSKIILKPELTISEEKNVEKAMRILEKSEAACLISRSIRSEIKLDPKMSVSTLV